MDTPEKDGETIVREHMEAVTKEFFRNAYDKCLSMPSQMAQFRHRCQEDLQAKVNDIVTQCRLSYGEPDKIAGMLVELAAIAGRNYRLARLLAEQDLLRYGKDGRKPS